MLHQKYVQVGQQKELVVVHNLRTTVDKQEAVKLFERQVKGCYDGEQSHLGELIVVQDAGPEAPLLHHIGLCYGRFVNIEAKVPETSINMSDQGIRVEFGDARNPSVEEESLAKGYGCIGALSMKLSP